MHMRVYVRVRVEFFLLPKKSKKKNYQKNVLDQKKKIDHARACARAHACACARARGRQK